MKEAKSSGAGPNTSCCRTSEELLIYIYNWQESDLNKNQIIILTERDTFAKIRFDTRNKHDDVSNTHAANVSPGTVFFTELIHFL